MTTNTRPIALSFPFHVRLPLSFKSLSLITLAGLFLGGCQINPVKQTAPAVQDKKPQQAKSPTKLENIPLGDQPMRYPVTKNEAQRLHDLFSPPADMVRLLASEFYLAHRLKDHPSVVREARVYQKYPTRLHNLLQRGRPFLYMIYTKVKRRNMPVELVMLPAVESSFNPFARSSQGAAGLWQFTYGTARVERIPMNRWYDGRLDPETSTDAALTYLEKLYRRVGEDWLLALAAYNAGIGNVKKAIENYRAAHPEDAYVSFWDIEPLLPRETRRYVPQLMAIAKILYRPEAYDIARLPSIPIKPQIKKVAFEKQISLDRARRHAGVSSEMFNRLNAGYKASITPPKGPHKLLLPIGKARKLMVAYRQNPALLSPPEKLRHIVRAGDTLYALARKYGASVKTIKRYNGLKSARLRIGQTLWIPAKGSWRSARRAQDTVVSQNTSSRAYKTARRSSRYYTVIKGDSLWSVARQFGMSVKELARVNRLSPKQNLRPGQKLLIPARYASRQVIHIVRRGENLWIVARHYGVSKQKLKKWNRLRTNTLHPGQKLTIWLSQR